MPGASILPAAVLHGGDRAALGQAGGDARGAVHTAHRLRLLSARASSRCWRCGRSGIPYWKVALAYALRRHRRRLRRHARVAFADRLCPGQARRHGLWNGRSAARPRRRDHAVDHGRAAHRGLRGGGRQARSPRRRTRRWSRPASKTRSPSPSRAPRRLPTQYPHYASAITSAARSSFVSGSDWAYAAGIVAIALRRSSDLLHVPAQGRGASAARRIPEARPILKIAAIRSPLHQLRGG